MFVLLLWWLLAAAPTSYCANVTYDHRALVIDGQRRVLISGSIHYPRSTPEVPTFFVCLFVLFYILSSLCVAKY